jgi:hypothetical protein
MNARSMLFEAFERAGFSMVRRRNHVIWRCPCGHAQIPSCGSPGRGRAYANAVAQIARTLRACNPERKAA